MKKELETLLRAKYPILSIISWEEQRVEETIRSVSSDLRRGFFSWSLTQGFVPPLPRENSKETRLSPELEALAEVYESNLSAVFLLKDFDPYMRDPRVIRLMRDIAARLRGRTATLVLTGPTLSLPPELEKEVTVIDFPLPNAREIGALLDKASSAVRGTPNINVDVTPEFREAIIKSAQGLTRDEIESTFARALVENKRFDLTTVLREKQQIIRKSGLLEYYPASDQLSDVGGMSSLKKWLDQRSKNFTDDARAFGLPAPKGVLLLGVQGCGKSLIAKAIASSWQLPMLKLDVGRIFGSLVGQSEENIRKAINVAESVAPCVLWADELEKGFAGVGGSGISDGGTTARVFATFLTWMQEKTSPVFLIATANDVSSLPPEMLRKGRFDEIFFVDLPKAEDRESIFRIHLTKRKRNPDDFDVAELSKLTEGFSGAEIEQAIIGALASAYSDSRELEQSDLELEVKSAVPLSKTMHEDIAALRDWAATRARPAD
ncbi:MAG: ATPase [Armatimonadota bacterium]